MARDTPDLLRRPGLLVPIPGLDTYSGLRGRARRCCAARSQEIPQGYGALPTFDSSQVCCCPPARPHRSAPQVTFKDFDYEL